MKKMKLGLGLAAATLMSITAASAFAATADDKKDTQNISAEVKTYEEGKMMPSSAGKTMLKKEILDDSEVGDNLTVELKTFEKGTMDTQSEGKELLKKEIVK